MRPVQEFLHRETAGAIALLVATLVALLVANFAGDWYESVWGTRVVLRVGDLTLDEDLRHVVNDGLMTLFFLLVGLEVKREIVAGELRAPRAAALPVMAALGGIAVPALVFVAIVGGGSDARGWGVPMATDIAFAIGVLALLGRRAPAALTLLLLAVAVIDDIVAITVIAIFYSSGISLAWLGAAIAGLALVACFNVLHVRHPAPYVVLGSLVWLATLESGVHATIAGVALGLLTPARPFQAPATVSAQAIRIADVTPDHPDDPDESAPHWRQLSWLSREAISPLHRIEHALHPWTSLVVLPLFALANAGVRLDADALDAALGSRLTLAVGVALVVGKLVGVTGGAWIAVRIGLARLPCGVSWRHVVGMASIAGIGFTVSLFITDLAFADPERVAAAKVGILAGSLVAAGIGAAVLAWPSRTRR